MKDKSKHLHKFQAYRNVTKTKIILDFIKKVNYRNA